MPSQDRVDEHLNHIFAMFCSFFEFMMRSLLSLVFGDLNRWCTRDDYFTTSDL